MTVVLQYDGVGWSDTGSDFATLTGSDWKFRVKFKSVEFPLTSSKAVCSNSNNLMQLIRLTNLTGNTGAIGWRLDNTFVDYGSGVDFSDFVDVVIERVAGVTSVYANGSLLSTTTRAELKGFRYFGGAIRGVGETNFPQEIQLELVEVWQSGVQIHNWSTDQSSHGAGNPNITDTIASKTAIGVNLPTDGSVWVDLGGGGIEITGGLSTYNLGSNDAQVDLTPQISIIGSVSGYDYSSIAASIDLTGTIEVEGALSSYSVLSNQASIDLTSEIQITAGISKYDSVSLSAAIELTPEIEITGGLSTYSYLSNNAIVDLTGAININADVSANNFSSLDATIELFGEININGQVSTVDYSAINGNVILISGDILDLSNIKLSYTINKATMSYGESKADLSYGENPINLSYED